MGKKREEERRRGGREEEGGPRRKGEGLDEASRAATAAKGGKETAKTIGIYDQTPKRGQGVGILTPTKNTLAQRRAATMRTAHMCQHSATTSQKHGKKRGERGKGRGETERGSVSCMGMEILFIGEISAS